jgi:hypothetical protein
VNRARVVLLTAAFGGLSSSAFAQAWVPPANIGFVTIAYQQIVNTGHRLDDGSFLPGFESSSRSMLVNFDYALTDRFSFSVGLPYVAAKYQGAEPSVFGLEIDECRCWNRGWQDVSATARYNVRNGAFALTPSVSFGVPSHDYAAVGEAAVGRNLREISVAVDAGQRLDAISDRLSVSARYSYAMVEQVDDVSNNRSNFGVEIAVRASRKASVRAAFTGQRTHGGLRSTEFTEDNFLLFDRILKDNSFHIGGGFTYSLPRTDLFLSFTHYASGTDTHAGRAVTFGFSVPFER